MTRAAVLTLCLITLTACAAQPVVQTRTIYESPPSALYPICDPPVTTIKTNGDLIRAYRDALATIDCYESGLEDLRGWPDEDESAQPTP